MKGWVLCGRYSEQFHQLVRIEFTSEGGFSVFVPYHKAQKGLCFMMPFEPISWSDSRFRGVVPGEFVAEYSADNRVKLSYHADGFVQFSSEQSGTIRSGRYADGMPKGLGIKVAPLSNPITSGPSIGVLCWGPHDFKALTREKSGTSYMKFEDKDCHYRGSCEKDWNAYLFEVFVFSPVHATSIWTDPHGRERFFLTFAGFEGGFAAFNFHVIRIPRSSSFLGILCSRMRAGFDSESGFNISGPTDFKWSPQAIYPFPNFSGFSAKQSINYDPSRVGVPLRHKPLMAYRTRFAYTNFIRTKLDGIWKPDSLFRDLDGRILKT